MNLEKAHIIEALPDVFRGPSGGEVALQRLAGAKIVRVGSTEDERIEGGGFIIDYELNAHPHRLVFAFSELGMWIAYDSFMEASSQAAIRDEFPRSRVLKAPAVAS